jgi:hypothetical protein
LTEPALDHVAPLDALEEQAISVWKAVAVARSVPGSVAATDGIKRRESKKPFSTPHEMTLKLSVSYGIRDQRDCGASGGWRAGARKSTDPQRAALRLS